MKIRFATSVYGDEYLGFLLVNLYSISKSNPRASISVIWDNVSSLKLQQIKNCFPKVDFEKSPINISGDFIKRISSKTRLWEHLGNTYQDQYLCLLDCDTLVLKDLSGFFEKDFDITFTTKIKQDVPINTGVMLVKNHQSLNKFFNAWTKKTLAILNNQVEFAKANNTERYPYGGSDQMSFYQLINFEKSKSEYKINIQGSNIILKTEPCAALNETNSRPLSPQMHIIHYKGGWRNILLRGRSFTKLRPKKQSFEMYTLFLKTYQQAIEQVKRHNPKASLIDFDIKIPFYLDKKTLTESKTKYTIFCLIDRLVFRNIELFKSLIKKIK